MKKKPEAKPADASMFSHPDPFVEIVWIILSIFVILYLINGFIGLINNGSFALFGLGMSDTQKTIPLSKAPTLLGGKVQTSKDTPVFAKPGVSQITTKPVGSKGTLLQGPIIKDGIKYWYVRFDDGVEGWVPEANLNYLKIEKVPLSQIDNPEGGKVSVSKNSTPVFGEPGLNQIAVEWKNATGYVMDGPETKDGVKYWKIHFDDGVEGWVVEGDLDYIKTDPTPLSSMPTIIGGRVITAKDDTVLYDGPDGKKIGTLKKGSPGRIIEGPIIKNGVKYWHIKFDDGKDGWVAEGDLEYIEGSESDLVTKTSDLLKRIFLIFKYVSVFFSLLFAMVVYHLYKKLNEIRTSEAKKFYIEKKESVGLSNPQWERILNHVESTGESDWRLAVLEADILLDTLLTNMGLPGDTMADKLKSVEKSDFTTIDNAWEAHKVRNQIAHEGATFLMSQHEARRVIALYQSVFEEFRII